MGSAFRRPVWKTRQCDIAVHALFRRWQSPADGVDNFHPSSLWPSDEYGNFAESGHTSRWNSHPPTRYARGVTVPRRYSAGRAATVNLIGVLLRRASPSPGHRAHDRVSRLLCAACHNVLLSSNGIASVAIAFALLSFVVVCVAFFIPVQHASIARSD